MKTINKMEIISRGDGLILPGVLSSRTRERWLEIMCERAIRRVLGKSGIPTWEIWSEQWLAGTDRSAGAASNAARSAASAASAANAAYNASYNAARNAANAATAAYAAANASNALYPTYENAYAVSTAAGAARDAEQRQQVRDLLFIIKGEIK